MVPGTRPEAAPLCPSAQPDMEGAVVFGIVRGTAEEPRVGYLEAPLAVSDEVLALTGAVRPTEVFRFGARCANGACAHFDGENCRLVRKIVTDIEPVQPDLPPCSIRKDCRWWKQEGRAACVRCPQLVTEDYRPTPSLRRAATP